MMTGERVGVGHDPQRGAAYVENWVAVLEKDPHEIHRAARDAQQMTITSWTCGRARARSAGQGEDGGELSHQYSHARGPQISQTRSNPRNNTRRSSNARLG